MKQNEQLAEEFHKPIITIRGAKKSKFIKQFEKPARSKWIIK